MWDIIRVLNTIVLARVSEEPFSIRVLKINRKKKERENPTITINIKRA
jgi:hypothetical protein